MILNRDEIKHLILEHGLVSGYLDLETQLQPCGFDLTVRNVGRFTSNGVIDFNNSKRRLPTTNPVVLPTILRLGTYSIDFNEKISLPLDLMAMSIHRSSVMRCGATTASGFWDAGYCGAGKTLLNVHNPDGLILAENARLCQMVFQRLNPVSKGYHGSFQNEGERNRE
jgi:dUTP pyrophosphatase